MGLLDLQECELDEEMEEEPERERRATIEEAADEAEEAFTRAGPTTRRAAVREKKRNDRPPAPTPLEKIVERTTGYQTTGSSKNAYAPDTHVLARCSANLGQWFGGTIVEGGEDGTCRVVFLDGVKEDVSISNIRVWDRPPLSDWHRKHQGPIKSRYVADVQSKANTHRSVLQFDLENGNLIAQFVSARRAVDNVPSLTDPQEVLQCCKGAVESAGGYKWTFAAPRPKLDASDVQELIDGNYAIQIQQRNPKKAGTKSALLYDQCKAVWKSPKSFHGDDVAALAPSSGEEPPSPRHRAGIRTRRKFDFHTQVQGRGIHQRHARARRSKGGHPLRHLARLGDARRPDPPEALLAAADGGAPRSSVEGGRGRRRRRRRGGGGRRRRPHGGVRRRKIKGGHPEDVAAAAAAGARAFKGSGRELRGPPGLLSIIVSELRVLALLGLVLREAKADALRQLDVLLGAARDAGLLLLFK